MIVIGIDLFTHLQRVPPVDEHRGFGREDHRGARRALKAGEPREALGIIAYIFAHMLVGERHDEAVKALRTELFAKGG